MSCIAKLGYQVSPGYCMVLRPMTAGISDGPVAHLFVGPVVIEIPVPDDGNDVSAVLCR